MCDFCLCVIFVYDLFGKFAKRTGKSPWDEMTLENWQVLLASIDDTIKEQLAMVAWYLKKTYQSNNLRVMSFAKRVLEKIAINIKSAIIAVRVYK